MVTIISDIDGVLVALSNAVYQSYKQAFAIQKVFFTKDSFQSLLVNQPWRPDIFKGFYPTIDLDKLRKDKQKIYRTKPVIINQPLITFFLCLKRQGNELIFITGGSKEATNHKLTNVNLRPDKLFTACQKYNIKFWRGLKYEAKYPYVWLFDDDKKTYELAKRFGINVIQYKFKGNQNAS